MLPRQVPRNLLAPERMALGRSSRVFLGLKSLSFPCAVSWKPVVPSAWSWDASSVSCHLTLCLFVLPRGLLDMETGCEGSSCASSSSSINCSSSSLVMVMIHLFMIDVFLG